MNWKLLISELVASGMTQRQIADHIGMTQGAISQVIRDETGRRGFKYEPGRKLVELHQQRCTEGRLKSSDDVQPPAGTSKRKPRKPKAANAPAHPT